MISYIIIALVMAIALVIGFAVVVNLLRRQMEAQIRQQLELSQTKAGADLEIRKQAVEQTVKGLKDELSKYQTLLREFEADRARKFGNIESELRNTSQATLKLQEVTGKLSNILGNVKLRGQWGERMAEDIIRYAGLIEGVNYLKQDVGATATKPDFTFLLPSGERINMDVKFPLDNYLMMVNCEQEAQREAYQKEFTKNVKDRIKEIQNRDYINPAENTLDFVLLFIPNEQVYGLIQEMMPDVMDFALKQKVVLCSPFTLYAMISVIRQAHENFRYEKDLKKIIELIDGFAKDYELFKSRFMEVGATLDKLRNQYADINDKSFKKIDTKIQRIDEYKKGSLPALESEGHPEVNGRRIPIDT